MNISMCACGGVNCPHCNPNLWTNAGLGNRYSEAGLISDLTKRVAELEAEIKTIYYIGYADGENSHAASLNFFLYDTLALSDPAEGVTEQDTITALHEAAKVLLDESKYQVKKVNWDRLAALLGVKDD